MNAVVDLSVGVGNGTSLAVSSLSVVKSIEDLVHCVPHGMQGQSYYLTINVLAKRTSQTHTQNMGPMGKSQGTMNNPQEKLPIT